MSDFLAALDAEIADLERQLSASPAYIRLREARRFRDVYTSTQGVSGHPATPNTPKATRVPRRGGGGSKAAVLDTFREYLAGRTEPTPINELMALLDEKGIEVGGAIPRNNVSSLLSKSEDFRSHGRSGWTLTEGTADDEEPAGVASSANVERQDDFLTEPQAEGREAVPGGGT